MGEKKKTFKIKFCHLEASSMERENIMSSKLKGNLEL